jgi:hypothetical protein
LGAEGYPVVAPVLNEGSGVLQAPSALASSAPVSSSAPPAAAEGVSLVGASRSTPASSTPSVTGNLEDAYNELIASQLIPLAATTRGHPGVVSLFSLGEHRSVLDFATSTVGSASNQLPQSLPFSGSLPAAPASGSASGGSGLGGAGPGEKAILSLLLIGLLGGKLLWHAREFLKPNSVYGQIVNQPG